MKNVLEEIKIKAKALQKKIVLCEGEDSRVLKAASDATKEGIAKIVLLGNEAEIKAANPDVDLEGVVFTDNCANFHFNFAFSLYFKKNVCYNYIVRTKILCSIIHQKKK